MPAFRMPPVPDGESPHGQPRDPIGGCTCYRLRGLDYEPLAWLDDLVAFGFEQPDASRMLWSWSRDATTRELRSMGLVARFAPVGRKGRS